MSKVNVEQFIVGLVKELEIQESISGETRLMNIKEYDSMGKINASLYIENAFGFQIDYEVLDRDQTVADLWKYCVSK